MTSSDGTTILVRYWKPDARGPNRFLGRERALGNSCGARRATGESKLDRSSPPLTDGQRLGTITATQARTNPMPTLHDPVFRSSIETRLDQLRPDSARKWGSMVPDQMLWHVNQFLESALGEGSMPAQKSALPAPIMRFMLVYMPWPKSAPTNKGAVPTGSHDFEAERTRCKALINRFVGRPLDGPWPADPTFGSVNGKFASKLQAKHLVHHLRQFST